MKSLETLQSQARNIEDDSLRLALVREVETIKQRFITAHQTLQQQQSHAVEMIQSTPPPEYQERYVDIKVAVDDALPMVTKEFQYAELPRLEDQMEACKVNCLSPSLFLYVLIERFFKHMKCHLLCHEMPSDIMYC